MTPDQRDRLRLYRTDGVGPVSFRRLLARFPTAAEALAAVPDLARAGGRREAPRIPTAADADREFAALRKLGGWLLLSSDPDFPPALAAVDDSPPVLMGLGARAALKRPAVAIVGARNATANGQRLAETLASDLVTAGYVVVSGMARGIDAAAHAGALSAPRPPARPATIACVAGGLDCPYPSEHADLQNRIAANGAVLSEAPVGTQPQARHFPRRNRVIAGLSAGVCVIEAALGSGSLITARDAIDAGRDVFAVPGSPLDPRCRGSNDLIRQGATLTETVADITHVLEAVRAMRPDAAGMAEPPPAWDAQPDRRDTAKLQQAVLSLIGASPALVDDLARRCQVPPGSINAVLLELELAGRIVSLPGGRVTSIPAEF